MTEQEAAALRAAAKEALRQRLSGLRRSLSADARQARSQAVCGRICDHASFHAANVLLGYWPLRFEVDPRQVLSRALQLGKVVALPRVVPGTSRLSLHRYRPGDALVESGFVVAEPREEAAEVFPDEVDLALVPGLAFDVSGHRLGFGKGYYDRLLPRLARARLLGLAFELSLVAELPAEPHDVPVHHVVTDARWLDAQSGVEGGPSP